MGHFRNFLLLLAIICLLPLRAGAAEAAIQNGDTVLIYAGSKALTASGSVDIILNDGAPENTPESALFTVEMTEGGFRLLQSGQTLGLTGNTLLFGGESSIWTLEQGESGGWYLKNANGAYLYLWASRNTWLGDGDRTEVQIWVKPQELPEKQPVFGDYRLYFGQLHGHADDPAAGYTQAKAAGMDFYALTEQSQIFDGGENAQISADATTYSTAWAAGKAAAEAATNSQFLGLFGYEMAFNQGQGHVSTLFTPGFASREQAAYQSYATGLESYYDALPEGSVSQLNHPGLLYGNFKDHSAHSPALDTRLTLMEVEGDLAEFDKALQAGWQVAPTSSAGRTAVLAKGLNETDFADALRRRTVYATLDTDLQVFFTLNGNIMGENITQLQGAETAEISVQLHDPTDSAMGQVSVIGENGAVLAEKLAAANDETLQFSLPLDQSYYYLRIIQPDGDWAVTAPIWLENPQKIGISQLKTVSEVPTARKDQVIALTVSNDTADPFAVSSLSIQVGEAEYFVEPFEVTPFGSETREITHSFDTDGVYKITANLTGTAAGLERTLTKTVEISVLPPKIVDDVIIFGSAENLENAMVLAKNKDIDLYLEEETLTAARLEECRLLILSTPSVELGDILKDYVNQGGTILLWGGPEQNPLLEKLGISARFGSEIEPQVGEYFAESGYTAGISHGQRFLLEEAWEILPENGEILVKSGEMPLFVEENGVLLAAGAFIANGFVGELPPTVWALPTANQTIFENILGISRTKQEVIPISDLRNAEFGRIYLTEGYITAGTANPNTTFYSTIYLQDETGGIAAGPYSAHGLERGTKVRILGSLQSDAGNPCLKILRLEVFQEGADPGPEDISLPLSWEDQGGRLLQVTGAVTTVRKFADGVGVSRFTVSDENGNFLELLVENEILSGSRGKNELARVVQLGNTVTAVGLLHLSEGSPVLRIRDCDEVILLEAAPEVPLPTENEIPTIPDITEDQPDTGDGKPVKLWLVLLVLSVLGLGYLKTPPCRGGA